MELQRDFSKEEKQILVQEVVDHRDIIEGEDGLHLTAAMKERVWDAVAEMVTKDWWDREEKLKR